MAALGNNVMQVLPPGDMNRQDYVKYLLQYIVAENKVFVVDYVDDFALSYTKPLTPGEYIITHNLLQDTLMYLGGQGLVDKIGNMGWLLLLLLELTPLEYNVYSNANLTMYREIFNNPEFEIEIPDNILDYPFWKYYYVLTGSTANMVMMEDEDFRYLLEGLENLPLTVGYILYSYLTRTMIETDIEYESDSFMHLFQTDAYTSIKNAAIMYGQNPAGIGINFGIVGSYNPATVLFAIWFMENYNSVNTNVDIDREVIYNRLQLEVFTDNKLIDYSGISTCYLDRQDLIEVIGDSIKYMNRTIPSIVDNKLVMMYKGSPCEIIRTEDDDEDEIKYETVPEIPGLGDKLNVIMNIIDYQNQNSTTYDRIRNSHHYYIDNNAVKTDLAYFYLLYCVQRGFYQGAYGTRQTRTESFLYKRLLADYLNYTIGSKYHKIPVGMIEDGILMQHTMTIDTWATSSEIDLNDLINTITLYRVRLQDVVAEAGLIWTAKYQNGNGGIIAVIDNQEINAISYMSIQSYVEYARRLCDYIYQNNEVLRQNKIVMYTDQVPEWL